MLKWGYLLAIVLISVGVSLIIIPTEDELALLNLNEKNVTVATDIYEKEVKLEKDPDQLTIIPLVELYLQKGAIDKALAALHKLIEDEPDNLIAHRYLAKVYKDSQNTHEYMKALEKLSKLDPDPEILREIANYNNFVQNEESQTKSLQKLVDQGVASSQEIVTLAKLYVNERKTEEAVELLEKVLPKAGESKKYENLYFLLGILIEDKNLLKVEHIAEEYISVNHMKASLEVIHYIVSQGERDLAIKLAKPLIKKAPFDPFLIQWQLDLLMANKRSEEAFILLQQLAEKKHLPQKLEKDFVLLASSVKDSKALPKALQSVELKALPNQTLLELAENFLTKKLSPEAHYTRLKLGADFLEKSPLLEMMLSAADKVSPSILTPEKVRDLKDIKPAMRLRLAQAFQVSNSPALAKTLLEGDFSFKGVSEKDIIGAIEAMIELGLHQKSFLIYLKEYPNVEKRTLNYQVSWALLATACEMEDKVTQWYKKNQSSLKHDSLLKLYSVASSHKNLSTLTEKFAQKLYENQKDETSTIRLVDAYLENKSYAKAEPLLKDLAVNKEGAWEYDYVAVLKKLHKQTELIAYWRSKAGSDHIDTKKKREIGFALLNAGDKKGAEKIFMELAESKNPKHPDVEQLFFIWGKTLAPKAVEWVEKHVQKAQVREKQEWLKILLQQGESTKVIKLIERMNLTDAKGITEIYMEALENIKDRQGLQKILDQEIEKKTEVDVLIKLADLASFSGSRILEKKAHKKLFQLYPNHPYVLKVSAEKDISRKKYAQAMTTLEKLFATGQEDVRSLYNYAEIIRNRQGLEKSKPYYEKVLKKLINSKEKSIEIDVIEAKSLYFIGKKADSLNKNKRILAENKSNNTLKADIAHFLMDVGELKEAEAVLNG